MTIITDKIQSEDVGLSIRKWFLCHYPEIPVGLIAKLLRTKQILHNNKPAKLHDLLTTDSNISFNKNIIDSKSYVVADMDNNDIKPAGNIIKSKKIKNNISNISKTEIESLKKSLLYQDENFLAFNKPGNMAVQKGSNIKKSMVDVVNSIWPKAKIVHRLDKHTSGAIIFAKNRIAAAFISKQFQAHEIKKVYKAILIGDARDAINKNNLKSVMPTLNNDDTYNAVGNNQSPRSIYEINMPLSLQMTELPLKNKKHAFHNDAENNNLKQEALKEAITHIQIINSINIKGLPLTKVLLMPLTGRKHQLRLHCAESLQTPILGDIRYGNKANQHVMKSIINDNKIYLHCYKMEFVNLNNKKISITANEPKHFNVID